MSGYFILSRQIFESAIWRDDSNILKLFIYLIGKARHSSDPKKYNGFKICRGELVTSLSQIAENNEYIANGRLKVWSRSKVSRMLSTLKEHKYIDILSDTYGTHISICNYSTYQDVSSYKSNTSATPLQRACNGDETQMGTNNNGKNVKNEKENPPNPQGDVVGEKANTPKKSRLTEAKKKRVKVTDNSSMMIRIGRWFGRKENTLWNIYEAEALEQVNPDEAEIVVMESFYTAEINKDEGFYRRQSLDTLLNNWTGELDKARRFLEIRENGENRESTYNGMALWEEQQRGGMNQ